MIDYHTTTKYNLLDTGMLHPQQKSKSDNDTTGRCHMKQVEEQRATLSASELGHQDKGAPRQAPGYILLPGDPNRVAVMAA